MLRAADLSFDFGFMLLEPYSTLESALANVDFLDACVGDGSSDAHYMKGIAFKAFGRGTWEPLGT